MKKIQRHKTLNTKQTKKPVYKAIRYDGTWHPIFAMNNVFSRLWNHRLWYIFSCQKKTETIKTEHTSTALHS